MMIDATTGYFLLSLFGAIPFILIIRSIVKDFQELSYRANARKYLSSELSGRHLICNRIGMICDDLTKKRSDICYTINNHALFDNSYPETAAFNKQLIYVQDNKNTLNINTLEVEIEKLTALYQRAVQAAEKHGVKGLKSYKKPLLTPQARRNLLEDGSMIALGFATAYSIITLFKE